MKTDPPMLRDPETKGGFLCAVDGKPLNDVTVKNLDPFCSAGCANVWHEFEPSSRLVTCSGHAVGEDRGRVPLWDQRTKGSRKRKEA